MHAACQSVMQKVVNAATTHDDLSLLACRFGYTLYQSTLTAQPLPERSIQGLLLALQMQKCSKQMSDTKEKEQSMTADLSLLEGGRSWPDSFHRIHDGVQSTA